MSRRIDPGIDRRSWRGGAGLQLRHVSRCGLGHRRTLHESLRQPQHGGAGQDLLRSRRARGDADLRFRPELFHVPDPRQDPLRGIWGFRPSASMPLLWRQILWARNAGAKLIVVDPERVKEVHQADLWLQPLPGTDTAVALGLIHAIIRESRHDAAFVESHTIGFDALRSTSSPIPRTCRISDVRAVREAGASRASADGKFPCDHSRWQRLVPIRARGRATGRAIACLVAITGNLGVEGGHALTGPHTTCWRMAMPSPAVHCRRRSETSAGGGAVCRAGRGF